MLTFIGFGQYLHDLVQELSRRFSGDVETPTHWSTLQDLDEYGHLAHIYRLCRIHGLRRIKLVDAPEDIRDAMRRLFCYRSKTWDEDVALIKSHPAGRGETCQH